MSVKSKEWYMYNRGIHWELSYVQHIHLVHKVKMQFDSIIEN